VTGLTGTLSLVRLLLRRDRIYLPVWVYALVGITYAAANGVHHTYDTPREIASYATNIGGSPAVVAFNGPPVALDTIGGILVYETSFTALLGVALMAVFLVVRHTRAEEEVGRTELLASTVVGRHAMTAAALLTAWVSSLVVGAGVAVSVALLDMPAAAAAVYGAGVAAFGIVFAALAATAAQLMTHARGAIGLCLAALGVAYLLRAVGDVRGTFWSWLSPMGWSQQVRPVEDDRWWPLGLSLLLTVALVTATVVLADRRDLGSGTVPPRPGPAAASRTLGSPLGLAWRLQRGSVLAWAAGVLAVGLMFGSVSEQVENMVRDNPTIARYLERASGVSLVDSFLATSLLLMSLAAGGFAVASALRTRAEETGQRLESVLATPVSRPAWLVQSLLVTLAGSVLVVVAGGLGLGLSQAAVTGDSGAVPRLLGDSLAYLPPVLVLAAVAVLMVGWLPRATALAWFAVAVCFVIGYLGGALRLPDWLENLSPFSHVPQVPAEDVSLAPLGLLTLVAVGAAAMGLAGFRRRDIG
jgi:ABC-2 type transport system permease protein